MSTRNAFIAPTPYKTLMFTTMMQNLCVLLHGTERVLSSQHHLGCNFRTQTNLHRRRTIVDAKNCKSLLQIAEVNLTFKGGTRRVFALLHFGSTHTWIAEHIVDDFGLPGEKQTVRIFGVNNEADLSTRHVDCNVTAAHPSELQPSSHDVYAYTKANLSIGRDS